MIAETTTYIDDQTALLEFISILSEANACAIDTEFVWERTYAPALGLIQIATTDRIGLIDPLAVSDLSVLRPILEDQSITKVFHAAGMDIPILRDSVGCIPSPVFDTQIAAAFMGIGSQVSYSFLVEHYLDISLEKSETITDWVRRPLTDKQIRYAAEDVHYLIRVYSELHRKLEARGRLEWAQEEFLTLTNPEKYRDTDPGELFWNVKRAGSLPAKDLIILKEMTTWRDGEARRRDLRPQFIIRDEALVDIAKQRPVSQQRLSNIRGVGDRVLARYGKNLIGIVDKASNTPDDQWPTPRPRKRISPLKAAASDLAWASIVSKAVDAEIAPDLLATKSELKELVEIYPELDGKSFRMMNGWRREIIGEQVLQVMAGELAVGVHPKSGVFFVKSSR